MNAWLVIYASNRHRMHFGLDFQSCSVAFEGHSQHDDVWQLQKILSRRRLRIREEIKNC